MVFITVNINGGAGKSVFARHGIQRRNPGMRFLEIESINLAPDIDEGVMVTLRGEQMPQVIREITLNRDLNIDLGASNTESFFEGLAQYEGTQESIDLFIIPVVPGEKEFADSVATVRTLAGLGVERERIRIVANKIRRKPEDEVYKIIRFAEKERLCVFHPQAYILLSNIYDHLMRKRLTIDEAIADPTDYEALAQQAFENHDDAQMSQYMNRIMIRRLAPTAKRNLDQAYDAIFADA